MLKIKKGSKNLTSHFPIVILGIRDKAFIFYFLFEDFKNTTFAYFSS
jgi:hypothetical protein